MAETVRAVTGLNLEYSRFNLPEKTNPFVATTISNPDCACFDNDSEYQFPLNWDTGPEALDVYFYPRNYSGGDQLLFSAFPPSANIQNIGISGSTSTWQNNPYYLQYNSFYSTYAWNYWYLYPFSFGLGNCYLDQTISKTLTTITLSKTENVFLEYPQIPKKCISGSNVNNSFNLLHITHFNISRKCWAGTGTLGNDEVLVIYSLGQNGINLIICYLNSAGSDSILHPNDGSYGPHAVLINLGSPGTVFGAKAANQETEGYRWNDSYFSYLTTGKGLNSYVTHPWFANYYYYYGITLSQYYSYGFSASSFSNNGLNLKSYATSNYKDIPAQDTTNWICYSGRPIKVKQSLPNSVYSQWREPTEEEANQIYNFGTGIDFEEYLFSDWIYAGAIPEIPENPNIPYPYRFGRPGRPADAPPQWSSPLIFKFPNQSQSSTSPDAFHYDFKAGLLNNPTYTTAYGWGGANGAVRFYWCGGSLANPQWCFGPYWNVIQGPVQFSSAIYSPYGGVTTPLINPGTVSSSYSDGVCFGFGWGMGYSPYFTGLGQITFFSYGTWEANPNPVDANGNALPGQLVAYNMGTPVNHYSLGDGTTNYQTMELVDVKEMTVQFPDFVPDYEAAVAVGNAWQSLNCGPGYSYNQTIYKLNGYISVTYSRAIHKITTHNIPSGVPYYNTGYNVNGSPVYKPAWLVPNFTEEGPYDLTAPDNKNSYLATKGYLNPVYDSEDVTAELKKMNLSSWNLPLGNSFYGDCVGSNIAYQCKQNFRTYPGNENLTLPYCDPNENRDPLTVVLNFNAPYVPFFLAGVRKSGGLSLPANLTDSKVRIFTSEENNAEEFRTSGYPKYFFHEFDPSKLLITPNKKIEVPSKNLVPAYTVYLPDYENSTTLDTGLPRATTYFQTVMEQPEHFQCTYKKGEFNKDIYFAPVGFFTSDVANEIFNFPEDLKSCSEVFTNSNLTASGLSVFLFNTGYGVEQFRSPGNATIPPVGFNPFWYQVYVNSQIQNYDFPELIKKINIERVNAWYAANPNLSESFTYLPSWVYSVPAVFTFTNGMSVFSNYFDFLSYGWESFIGTYGYPVCGWTRSVLNSPGTDLCSGPEERLIEGTLSPNGDNARTKLFCGDSVKKSELTYEIVTIKESMDRELAYKQSVKNYVLDQMKASYFASVSVPMEYKKLSGFTLKSSTPFPVCEATYSTIAYEWPLIYSDAVVTTPVKGIYNANYSYEWWRAFTTYTNLPSKGWFEKTIPVYGKVAGRIADSNLAYNYYVNGQYAYWMNQVTFANSYLPFESFNSQTSFLECKRLLIKSDAASRMKTLSDIWLGMLKFPTYEYCEVACDGVVVYLTSVRNRERRPAPPCSGDNLPSDANCPGYVAQAQKTFVKPFVESGRPTDGFYRSGGPFGGLHQTGSNYYFFSGTAYGWTTDYTYIVCSICEQYFNGSSSPNAYTEEYFLANRHRILPEFPPYPAANPIVEPANVELCYRMYV